MVKLTPDHLDNLSILQNHHCKAFHVHQFILLLEVFVHQIGQVEPMEEYSVERAKHRPEVISSESFRLKKIAHFYKRNTLLIAFRELFVGELLLFAKVLALRGRRSTGEVQDSKD